MQNHRIARRRVDDPRLLLVLLTGLCPECGALAQPADEQTLRAAGIEPGLGWVGLVHAPDCTVEALLR